MGETIRIEEKTEIYNSIQVFIRIHNSLSLFGYNLLHFLNHKNTIQHDDTENITLKYPEIHEEKSVTDKKEILSNFRRKKKILAFGKNSFMYLGYDILSSYFFI